VAFFERIWRTADLTQLLLGFTVTVRGLASYGGLRDESLPESAFFSKRLVLQQVRPLQCSLQSLLDVDGMVADVSWHHYLFVVRLHGNSNGPRSSQVLDSVGRDLSKRGDSGLPHDESGGSPPSSHGGDTDLQASQPEPRPTPQSACSEAGASFEPGTGSATSNVHGPEPRNFHRTSLLT
jgi:hypothetical protein